MKITADLIPDVVLFRIHDFSKWNPRKDVTRSSWFRLQNNWYSHRDYHGLTGAQLVLIPVLLGVYSESTKEQVDISLSYLRDELKSKTNFLRATLAELHNREIIEVTNLLTVRDVDIRTNERTKRTLRTNGCQADEPVPDKTPPKAKNTPTLPAPPKATPPKGRGSPVWDAYAEAYRDRYRTEPKRNQKANAICAQLVDRLGVDDAIAVVRFYLSHNKAWYVQRVHPLDACLADCEGLHTQRLHNFRVTTANARQEEVRQSNLQTFQAVAERLAEKHLGRKDQHDEH